MIAILNLFFIFFVKKRKEKFVFNKRLYLSIKIYTKQL